MSHTQGILARGGLKQQIKIVLCRQHTRELSSHAGALLCFMTPLYSLIVWYQWIFIVIIIVCWSESHKTWFSQPESTVLTVFRIKYLSDLSEFNLIGLILTSRWSSSSSSGGNMSSEVSSTFSRSSAAVTSSDCIFFSLSFLASQRMVENVCVRCVWCVMMEMKSVFYLVDWTNSCW